MLSAVLWLLVIASGGLPPAAAPWQETAVDVQVDRVRRQIDAHPTPSRLLKPQPHPTPTFRIEINAPKPLLRTFDEQMREALVSHGASFTVGSRRPIGIDVLATIAAIRAAYYRAEVERTRREVEAELAVIKARWEARK